MSPSPIRIALLICDTPMASVVQAYGAYHAIYTAILTRSLPEGVPADRFVLDPYDVQHTMAYPADLDGYDAVMLTGSKSSAYAELEWINKLVAYVKAVAEHTPRVKIIGICFGHQIIARALGGACVPTGAWEIGPSDVQLSALGKQIFGGRDTLSIQQCHRDIVPAVPTHPFPFQSLGSTPQCANQGMDAQDAQDADGKALLRRIRIFTVQGHPEFHRAIVRRIIDAREADGAVPADEEVEVGAEEGWVNDGRDIGRVVWGILGLE
ncbi:class I glutamine amidotransferase-like protein [Athelia psychrophila]|uniref:Class I glutamine amidotransferase-like protein n=1 Tax=Athelia psychrophila TaxID=1759441 RepID=A0A166R9S0_9AGAM|nr:class I glutamine amidotransferase-like protein [Fibularhizoctonia sp. CBS 109695]